MSHDPGLPLGFADPTPADVRAAFREVPEIAEARAAIERLRRANGGGDGARADGVVPTARPVGALEVYLARYVVLPAHALLPLALWAAGTHIADTFDSYAYLAITSPAKRCGKTRLLELLEIVTRAAWRGVTPSPAALFRFLDQGRPTLLLDEVEKLADKRAGENELALIAILNAGHRRGASVMRCDGAAHDLRQFDVYGPKALACIGRLPDTIADRSIVIAMQRRLPSQKVERFLFARAQAEGRAVAERLASAVTSQQPAIAAAYAALPDLDFLGDRDADLWGPLFAACSALAPARMAELKRDAIALCGGKTADDADDSLPLRLLSDIRATWPAGEHASATTAIIERVRAVEDSPWAAEVELTPRRLARFLRPFEVERRQVKIAGTNHKGYLYSDLESAFHRYLASEKATEATSQ